MPKKYNIVVGVTGGIASYKSVEIVSRLKKAGHNVDVIMTNSATQFVTPLTFRQISSNDVVVDMFESKSYDVKHISLAEKADLFLIAPATANIIGKISNGIADDMLSTTVMATKAPIMIVPAMNTNMYQNAIFQENLLKLKNIGYHIIEPESGYLACGKDGLGRMPEPSTIVENALTLLENDESFSGLRVLVTAGGTREEIDPVRYIGNRSSGKMGYALAEQVALRGADVILVSGNTTTSIKNNKALRNIKIIKVESAENMRKEVIKLFDNVDIVIKAAAVADYRVENISDQKIKKAEECLNINLVKNPDILKELGQLKKEHQILVGFAAETEKLLENANLKLISKNLDLIVANDVTLEGSGFDSDTNIIKLIYRDGTIEEYPQMTKKDLADIILTKIHKIKEKST